MTKRNEKKLIKSAALTESEWLGLLSGRIERLHFQRAAIRRYGNGLLMDGPSGEHVLSEASNLERVNAHWTHFATHSANLWG